MTHEEIKVLLDRAEEELKIGNYTEAGELSQKLLSDTNQSSVPQGIRIRTLLILSESLWRCGMAREAFPFAEEGLTLAILTKNKGVKAKAMGNIGIVYRNLSNYPRALEYYQKALTINEELGNKDSIAINLGNIANVYSVISDYSRALEYYKKALAILEDLGNKGGIARNLGNIGGVYLYLSDYSHALEYYRKALDINEELGRKDGIARNLANIGNIYDSLADYPTALDTNYKALAIFEEIGNKESIARAFGNIGIVYRNLLDYPRAMEYSQKAVAIYEELGRIDGLPRNLSHIGVIYGEKKYEGYSAEKAEEYLLRAIAICEAIGAKQELYEFHSLLAQLYKKLEQWKDFACHFEKFYELEKEVQNKEVANQAQRFAIERDVAVLQREQEILQVKNAELAELNTKLEETNIQLIKVNSEKNEFLGIASHDLKNPLNSITMIATILKEEAGTLKIEEMIEFADDIRTSSKQMFDLIINLLDFNKIEQGSMLPGVELFSAGDCAHSVVERYVLQSHNKNIQLVEEIEDVQVRTSKATLIQVLDNIISNAIKFSPFDKNIFVRAESNDQFVRISIQDEGPGLTDEDKKKLFGQFTRLSAKPTGGEHSSGLGLSIVKRMVGMMNGKIWCESEFGKGATFIVELPKA